MNDMFHNLQDMTQTVIAVGMTSAVIYLMVSAQPIAPEFMTVYAGVVGFYFAAKKNGKGLVGP